MSANRKRPSSQKNEDSSPTKGKRTKKNQDNTSTSSGIQKRAGTISRITLKNFMCHAHLEVNLQNNINYIVGRNGSGKSAILTALVVGLSGKASLTNHETSIKDFIKAGQSSATIEVVLDNIGHEAYRPSTYGNTIIIERHFTANGNITHKIKTAAGKVISESAKDIKSALDHLNIQIDNPVCILNEDTSRNFLNTNDPKQKFILFMRAAGLEKSLEELLCRQLYNTRKELQRKMEIFKNVDRLRMRQAELLWARIRDVEEEVNDRAKVVSDLQNKCKTYEDNSKNKGKRLEEIKQKLSELQRQILELQEAAEIHNRSQIDLQNQIDRLKQSYSEKSRSKQQILKQIEDKHKNIANIANEIENFTANLNKIEQGKLAKKKEMNALEEQIKHIENMIEITQNDIYQTKYRIKRQKESKNDLQRELRQKRNKCDEVRDQITALNNESNSLVMYGKDMPRIVDAIKRNEHRFTQLPRGPLGDFITVKDIRWVVAIEGFLGVGLLRTFTVDNKKDNAILMEILNTHCSGQKPVVITGKFFDRVHDIRPNLVHADRDCISLYNAIDIKDPVVANCLIDQLSIESILLIPSTERAIELLSNRNKVPRNCRGSITIKGDQYFPDPNYKMYASRYHTARFLQVDTSDLIRGHEETLAELTTQINNIQGQMNAIVLDKSKQKMDLEELINKFDRLRRVNIVAKRKLKDLSTTEDLESIDVQSLENEMSELKAMVQQLTMDSRNIEQQMKTITEDISSAENRLRELSESEKKFEDRIAPLEQQIKEQSSRKQEFDVNRAFEKKRLQEVKSKLEQATYKLSSKLDEMNKLKEQASSICERMEDVQEVREILAEKQNVQTDIRKAESSEENVVDVKRRYEYTKSRYEQVAVLLKDLQENIKHLNLTMKNRKEYCKEMEDYFVNCINHMFSRVLAYRQFKGNLEIDTINKTLELMVIPRHSSQGDTATSNLSCGECPFFTVVFLYALWQCTNLPFYFLDEFDVFMDKINMGKVMEILTHHAKTQKDRQYVFLTRQDVPFIRDDDVHTIHLDSLSLTNSRYLKPWRSNILSHQDSGSTIANDSEKFQVILDVQQFASNEITVKTSNNSIVVEGKHEEKQDEHGYISRHFVRRFILPVDHDINDVVSTLSSDGILTVSAPKKSLKPQNTERVVPITQTGPAKPTVTPVPDTPQPKIEHPN